MTRTAAGGGAWGNLALALGAGLLLWGGHPPLDQGWLGIVALAPLVALARRVGTGAAPLRRGAGWGLLAGGVFFAPLLYWLVPFGYAAFGLLTLIQALSVSAYVAAMAWVGERRGRALVAVVAWVGLERLRAGWPLGGFSWGVLGYTQHDGGLLLGSARTLGVYGVSLLLATIAVALEEGVTAGLRAWPEARATDVPADAVFSSVRNPLLTILGALSIGVLLAGEAPAPSDRTIEVGIAQAGDTRATSAAGVNREDRGRIERVAELALAATEPFAADPPDLVVWPENSLDIDVRTDRGADIAAILQEAVDLVAPTPILAGEYQVGEQPRTLFNQMTVFTTEGAGDSYVKRQPVPFGEYVPARDLLDWFPPLAQIPNDTLPGDAAQVLDVAGARVGGVICFENTFDTLVRDQVLAGADLLVVGTNNSSFGDTAMSRQHLAFSQVRAVETGRWVVHAGISGISGFVDPDGVVHEQTGLFTPASPRMAVPLVDGRTASLRVAPVLATLVQLLAVGGLVVAGLERRRERA